MYTLENAKIESQKAISYDFSGEYLLALDHYKKAIGVLLYLTKYEKNDALKKRLLIQLDQYITRAEYLSGNTPEQPKGESKPQIEDIKVADSDDDSDDSSFKSKLDVSFDDVIGLDSVKQAIHESVILPSKFPSLFFSTMRKTNNILLYGYPGTGKTLIAKATACETDSKFYSISSSDIVSKWQGESERNIKSLFEKARKNNPSIIFIDEIDSIGGERESGDNDASRRIKTELLIQMQGVNKNNEGITIIASTNIPWILDPALRRRFNKRIFIDLPNKTDRMRIIKVHAGEYSECLSNEDLKELAGMSEGLSPSDIANTVEETINIPLKILLRSSYFKEIHGRIIPCDKCRKCSMLPICDFCGAMRVTLFEIQDTEKVNAPEVQREHFFEAFSKAKPTIGTDYANKYKTWTSQFGKSSS